MNVGNQTREFAEQLIGQFLPFLSFSSKCVKEQKCAGEMANQ